jgi:O-antigen ligase
MKRETHLRIFETIVGALFLLPLVFYSGFFSPFGTTQTILFITLIEFALPYYLFLLHKFPEHKPSFRNPFILAWIGFLSTLTISAIIGVDPWNSFFGNVSRTDGLILHYHLFAFFFYLQFLFQTKKQIASQYTLYLIWITTAVAIIGILQYFNIISLFSGDIHTGRVSSTLGNPNFFAASLIIPFFFSINQFFSNSSRNHRLIYAGIISILFLGVIASGTRGALLGIISGLLFAGVLWVFKQSSIHTRKRITTLLILSLLVSGSIFLSIRTFSSENTALYRLTHFADESTGTRLVYWNLAIKGWLDRPLSGVGHQNFYHIADKHYEKELYDKSGSWPDKVHNTPLEILATGGIFAFLFYGFMLISLCRQLWQNPKQSINNKIFFISALTAYFIQNCFGFDTIIPLVQISFLFAIMTLLQTSNEKKPFPLIWSGSAFVIIIVIMGGFLIPTVRELNLLHSADIKTGYNNKAALEDLERAKKLSFIFDIERIGKLLYLLQKSEVSTNTSQEITNKRIADLSIEINKQVVKRHPQKAFVWFVYANALNLHTYVYQGINKEESFNAAERILELAPTRAEGFVVLSNLHDINNEPTQALFYAQKSVEIAQNDPEILWNLAYIYLKQEQKDLAAEIGLKSMKAGLIPTNVDSLNWLIDYFVEKQNTENVVFLYERSVYFAPEKIALLPKLAAAYALNNQKNNAIDTALLLKQKDPSSGPEVDAFIQSLR